jgi:DNA-binding IclR family transcriptional regulator
LIERTPENRFRLGLKLYELGNRAVEQIDLRARVQPYFRRLAMQVGETVHLGVLQKTSVVYLDKVEPNRRVCLSSKTGTSNPVYCTSMGKAMLAFQPDEIIEQVIAKIRFVAYTPKTIGSREALLKALERIRRRGYAIDDEEIELGVRCVGAPIFNEDRRAIAAVSVSGPTARITVQSVPGIAEHVLRCCREISTSLGLSTKKRLHLASPFLNHYGD